MERGFSTLLSYTGFIFSCGWRKYEVGFVQSGAENISQKKKYGEIIEVSLLATSAGHQSYFCECNRFIWFGDGILFWGPVDM